MDRDEQRELAVNAIRKVRDVERRGSKSRNRGIAEGRTFLYTRNLFA
jgi:hypothetical protein